MMEVLFTFDIRGERLRIVRDECPEHPLNSTDAPFYTDNYTDGRGLLCFWRNHESKADSPSATTFSRDTGYAAVYFDSDGDECEYFRAAGALYVDKEEWLAYAGAPITKAALLGQLAELRAYWQGDCYGFTTVKTFKRSGSVYETSEPGEAGSCYGFYGREGIASMASCLRPAQAAALRKALRTDNL